MIAGFFVGRQQRTGLKICHGGITASVCRKEVPIVITLRNSKYSELALWEKSVSGISRKN
jgi:hypothetical protein